MGHKFDKKIPIPGYPVVGHIHKNQGPAKPDEEIILETPLQLSKFLEGPAFHAHRERLEVLLTSLGSKEVLFHARDGEILVPEDRE